MPDHRIFFESQGQGLAGTVDPSAYRDVVVVLATAGVIVPLAKSLKVSTPVIEDLLSSDRLRLNLYWASENKRAADEVFKAAITEGYLKNKPTDGILYDPGK